MHLLYIVVPSVLVIIIFVALGWHLKGRSSNKEIAEMRRQNQRNAEINTSLNRHRDKTPEQQSAGVTFDQGIDEEQRREVREQRAQRQAEALAMLAIQEAEEAVQAAARLATERAQIEPQLARLNELRSLPLSEVPFEELHALAMKDGDEPVSIFDHLTPEEDAWFDDAYEKLAIEKLRQLMEGAIAGSESDYQRVRQLDNELNKFSYFGTVVRDNLAEQWDRMVLCHADDLNSDELWDELINYDKYHDDGLKLYDQAMAGDFFSACLVIVMMDEGDEHEDIVKRLIEECKENMRKVVDQQRPLDIATSER